MADLIGTNQAQNMLQRVSPEGRARALHERQQRQRRNLRVAGRVILFALAAIAILVAADFALGSLTPPIIITCVIAFITACAVDAYVRRPRPAKAAALGSAPLSALPGATASWLDAQRQALPAPAAALIDSIVARLQEMAPQLDRIDAREPAADNVRRLLAIELPNLLERHQAVPPSLRSEVRDGGQSVDAHLLNGLRIASEEVARMTAQLAAGDVNAVATQDRFLELKYQGDEILRPQP
jgi:predicted PurR-regulated permease PerM